MTVDFFLLSFCFLVDLTASVNCQLTWDKNWVKLIVWAAAGDLKSLKRLATIVRCSCERIAFELRQTMLPDTVSKMRDFVRQSV